MCPISTSDHNIMKSCFVVSNRPDGSENIGNYFYDFQSADYSEMSKQLALIDWYYKFSFLSSVEEYWTSLKHYLLNVIDNCVPKKKIPEIKTRNRKCYPRHIKSTGMLNRKAILWKRWRVSKEPADKQAHKNYSLKCKNTVLAYQKAKELALINKCNSGSFFPLYK